MTRAAAWGSCNGELDERWHSQWQAHRNRIEFIRSANSVSAQAFSNALASSGHPHRIHTSRSNWNSLSPVKLVARSKSPAAKSRQKQIDRDNLILIKKLIALDNAKAATPRCGDKKKRTTRAPPQKSAKAVVNPSTYDRNTIVVPEAAHSNHECPRTLQETPQTAASHALYTRASATMKNNFAEYNAPTMMHSSNTTSAAARVRARVQSKILDENKKILRRILTARTTLDRSELERHEQRHNKLRTTMSRHQSTSRLLQQSQSQSQSQSLRSSRSQSTLQRGSGGDDDTIRVDPISHFTQQLKRRPRSASQAPSRTRAATSYSQSPHTSRRSVSNESLVSRMRKMTMDSQRDGM